MFQNILTWLKSWFEGLNTSNKSEIYSWALSSDQGNLQPSPGSSARTCRPSLLHTLWRRQVSSQLPQTINPIKVLHPSPLRPHLTLSFFHQGKIFPWWGTWNKPRLNTWALRKCRSSKVVSDISLKNCLENILRCRSSIRIILYYF